jgi:hypothetical protein
MNNYFASLKFTLSVLFIWSFNTHYFGQKKEIDVVHVKTSEFPKVSGDIWVRNPNGIDKKTISISENGKVVPIDVGMVRKIESSVVNKSIVFLVQNTANQKQIDWCKSLILNAFDEGAIKKGDKIDIVFFSRLQNNQASYPYQLSFTDNYDSIEAKLDSHISFAGLKTSGACHTYIAVNEVLNLLDNNSPNLPTGIFVLSNDQSLTSKFEGETPFQRSRKLDIPVYAIAYNSGYPIHTLSDFCKQTYGVFFRDSDNSEAVCSKQLNSFLNDFIQKQQGLYYPFSFVSNNEKGTGMAKFTLSTKTDKIDFTVDLPDKNWKEWIQDNLILVLVLSFLFFAATIITVVLVKRNKEKRKKIEEERLMKLAEVENQQKLAEQKIIQQEQEIQRIHLQEQQQKEDEIRRKQVEAQKQEDEVQLQKMLERGNFPWFEFKFGSESGSYQIQTPRLNVGRDNSNTWVINHPTVSKEHFTLTFKDYIYTLEDLNSTNGTYVNGVKITQTILKHGDCIQVGDITLTIHI